MHSRHKANFYSYLKLNFHHVKILIFSFESNITLQQLINIFKNVWECQTVFNVTFYANAAFK